MKNRQYYKSRKRVLKYKKIDTDAIAAAMRIATEAIMSAMQIAMVVRPPKYPDGGIISADVSDFTQTLNRLSKDANDLCVKYPEIENDPYCSDGKGFNPYYAFMPKHQH